MVICYITICIAYTKLITLKFSGTSGSKWQTPPSKDLIYNINNEVSVINKKELPLSDLISWQCSGKQKRNRVTLTNKAEQNYHKPKIQLWEYCYFMGTNHHRESPPKVQAILWHTSVAGVIFQVASTVRELFMEEGLG